MKYHYKDFVTGKIHYTRGRFVRWTKPTGLLHVPYAQFQRGSDFLFIPRYSLTKETLQILEQQTQASA